ncbi:hypothetical protein CVT26_014337 [Gymnopilus dilepis]|uniref:Nephrocystin 3-like N-terminal domain-containing protein n=1 Tax=Gymnopilus dilepis TaxID=231916 RepID=A0A409Y7E3_9AGAR|nr:hypothetical protein CVT26_014337 [Gymnopilus dilepis]
MLTLTCFVQRLGIQEAFAGHVCLDITYDSNELACVRRAFRGEEALLQELHVWASNATPEEISFRPMAWLHGPRGTGKTAIAVAFADLLSKQGRLAASFFFKKDDMDERQVARIFVPSIAYQMLVSMPELEPFIAQAVEKNPLVFGQSIETQMEQLIVQPIEVAPLQVDPPLPKVVVIDGLNACPGMDLQDRILAMVGSAAPRIGKKVQFLVTSRERNNIDAGFILLRPVTKSFTVDHDDPRRYVEFLALMGCDSKRVEYELKWIGLDLRFYFLAWLSVLERILRRICSILMLRCNVKPQGTKAGAAWALLIKEAFEGRVILDITHDSNDLACVRRAYKVKEAFLDQLYNWASTTTHPIAWLRGNAGVGKTAVAVAFADLLSKQDRLAASFFLKRGGSNERQLVEMFVPSIAYQMLVAIPELEPLVAEAIEKNPLVFGQSVETQMKQLVVQPVQAAQLGLSVLPLIIVIDSLDACPRQDLQGRIVAVLGSAGQRTVGKVKFLVTSRGQSNIDGKIIPLRCITQSFKMDRDDVQHQDYVGSLGSTSCNWRGRRRKMMIAIFIQMGFDFLLLTYILRRLERKEEGVMIPYDTAILCFTIFPVEVHDLCRRITFARSNFKATNV